jgi:hypothetical protein
MIEDLELAEEVRIIERDTTLSSEASRAGIREAVNRRYTGPA